MILSQTSDIDHALNSSTPVLTEELVAQSITGIIGIAKANGRSLQDLMQEVLTDDQVLDQSTRYWLGNILSQAWELPTKPES